MPKSVYLVEDSILLRKQIVRALDEMGVYALAGVAGRADIAIREIRALQPHVIIADLQLEKGSGWDVVDAVADLDAEIIILSNHSTPPFRTAAQSRRIRHFFDKTNEFDAFLESLQSLG